MVGVMVKPTTQIIHSDGEGNQVVVNVSVIKEEGSKFPISLWVCQRKWYHRKWYGEKVMVKFRRKPGRPYRLISNWAVNVRPVKWWKFLLFW